MKNGALRKVRRFYLVGRDLLAALAAESNLFGKG